MCAGGLPLSNKSNPIDAVLAGLGNPVLHEYLK